jgi:hypothetical protein
MNRESGNLPSDIKKESISPFIDNQSLNALSQVNKDLNDLTKEELKKEKRNMNISNILGV